MTNVFEFQYDLAGNLPPQIYIPHVALRITDDQSDRTFDMMMLVDAGARSDITFSRRSERIIKEHMGENFRWENAGFAIGPITSLEARASYSHWTADNAPLVGGATMLGRISTLRKGARDANTMSFAYFNAVNKKLLLEPGAAPQRTITEYFEEGGDGPRPFYTGDLGFPAAIPRIQHRVKSRNVGGFFLKTALRGPNGSVIQDFCWDTGAWRTCIPQGYLDALGVVGTVLDKVSLQTSAGNIVTFLNVPVDTDYPEPLLGADLFTRMKCAIDPAAEGWFDFRVLAPPAGPPAPVTLPHQGWTWPPAL